jgi:hypothetical protein
MVAATNGADPTQAVPGIFDDLLRGFADAANSHTICQWLRVTESFALRY